MKIYSGFVRSKISANDIESDAYASLPFWLLLSFKLSGFPLTQGQHNFCNAADEGKDRHNPDE